jgi:riboflavin synthase
VYTGIVEELGEVVAVEAADGSARLRVRGPLVTTGVHRGDSIAINGVCLTVTEASAGEFSADVMGETLRRSSLGQLVPGSAVNLERPVRPDGRLGGHIVQGHVDGTGEVVARRPAGDWEVVRISLPAGLARYVVEKGSVAIDGVSLTVSAVSANHDASDSGNHDASDSGNHDASDSGNHDASGRGGPDRPPAQPARPGPGQPPAGRACWLEVSLIPETLRRTTLGSKQPGEPVNLEVDVIAKYVERLLPGSRP